jgi:hypothetical protein
MLLSFNYIMLFTLYLFTIVAINTFDFDFEIAVNVNQDNIQYSIADHVL